MKKALGWLDDHNVDYTFHDYKKEGIDKSVLERAIDEHGWDVVINKRGTTWKQLPPSLQEQMDAQKALQIAEENPSIVKRPLLVKAGKTHIGFKAEDYAEIF